MAELRWRQLPDGGAVASGDDWSYFVAHDDRQAVLTRWELPEGRDELPGAAAIVRQVALNTIRLGGAYGVMPGIAAADIAYLKRAAQIYESGLDVMGQPGWRHGCQGTG